MITRINPNTIQRTKHEQVLVTRSRRLVRMLGIFATHDESYIDGESVDSIIRNLAKQLGDVCVDLAQHNRGE